jgi:hypothetical protein
VIVIQTRTQTRRKDTAPHLDYSGQADPRPDLYRPEQGLDLSRTIDSDNFVAMGGNDENGESKVSLPKLMGYDPKEQRAEYMKSRRLAKKTAHPLLLNKAWRRYSQDERSGAVERVFQAFKSQYCTHTHNPGN